MTMRYRVLGGTGIEVSHHCLGAMMFGSVGQQRPRRGRADHPPRPRRGHQLRRHRRHVLGRRVRGDRRQGACRAGATTSCWPRRCTSRWARAATAAATRGATSCDAVEDSLRRLGTDWIDLYQVHRPDYRTDIEETLSVLTDLVRDGKIRAFGCSTFPAEEIVEAHHVALNRGLLRFRTEQPPYSLLARGIERSVLPTCATARHGRAGVEPARPRVPVGQAPAGAGRPRRSGRR